MISGATRSQITNITSVEPGLALGHANPVQRQYLRPERLHRQPARHLWWPQTHAMRTPHDDMLSRGQNPLMCPGPVQI